MRKLAYILIGALTVASACVVIPFGAVAPIKSKSSQASSKDKWSTETQIYMNVPEHGTWSEIKVNITSSAQREGKDFHYFYSLHNQAKNGIVIKWESVETLPRSYKSEFILNPGEHADFELISKSEPSIQEGKATFYMVGTQEKIYLAESKAPAYVP